MDYILPTSLYIHNTTQSFRSQIFCLNIVKSQLQHPSFIWLVKSVKVYLLPCKLCGSSNIYWDKLGNYFSKFIQDHLNGTVGHFNVKSGPNNKVLSSSIGSYFYPSKGYLLVNTFKDPRINMAGWHLIQFARGFQLNILKGMEKEILMVNSPQDQDN